MSYDLSDYVDVKQRLTLFYKRYPEGSIQFQLIDVREIAGKTVVIGQALAYRTPDDPRPASGTAWELVPGSTPYTRGSELMNLETSCWGRAIGALGIGLGSSIATSNEIWYAQQRQETGQDAPPIDMEAPGGIEAVEQLVEAKRQEMGYYRGPARTHATGDQKATDKQLGYLRVAAKALGYESLADFLSDEIPQVPEEKLTRAQASAMIDVAKARAG